MISTMQGIGNDNVVVVYFFESEVVSVVDNATNQKKLFSGHDALKGMFDVFCEYFTENTSFQDCIEYFKPNYSISIIK